MKKIDDFCWIFGAKIMFVSTFDTFKGKKIFNDSYHIWINSSGGMRKCERNHLMILTCCLSLAVWFITKKIP